jgi:hypothetical protein
VTALDRAVREIGDFDARVQPGQAVVVVSAGSIEIRPHGGLAMCVPRQVSGSRIVASQLIAARAALTTNDWRHNSPPPPGPYAHPPLSHPTASKSSG